MQETAEKKSLAERLALKLGLIGDDGERTGPKGVPTQGPVGKVRYITNGQARRQRSRDEFTEQRKVNRRYKKRWFDNERAVAALRGKLQVVGAIPFSDPDFVISQDHPMHAAAVRSLVEGYGSVEKALERYNEIEAEKALRRIGSAA